MAPKEKSKKRKTAIVVAQPVVVEGGEEMTADQLRYIAEPWFTTIPDDVMKKARDIRHLQGAGVGHATANLAKTEMMRRCVEQAGLGDSGAVAFLGGVRALHCLFWPVVAEWHLGCQRGHLDRRADRVPKAAPLYQCLPL